ncbi:MAG: type II secretion system protein GspL [Candidimonas sp.]|jgi:general secretion pathway protein L
MKSRLRLALPPLTELTPTSIVPFALLDRDDRLLRSGELALGDIARSVPADHVQAILHPRDSVVATVVVPPLSSKRLYAAVQSSVEPMALDPIEALCVAHGPRAPDGSVQAAWTSRSAFLRAWRLLDEAGLDVTVIVPFALAIPENDPHPSDPLSLPVGARWQAPLPRWSLARPEWRPSSPIDRWRAPLKWAGAAALLWLVGLQIHAVQLRKEINDLQTGTEQAVRNAFPGIPVIIDPVRQARAQRDMLRLADGAAGEDDFMSMASSASKVLDFADGHVRSLLYEDGQLTLVLTEGYVPPANEAGLHQAASVHSLILTKDDNVPHTWRFRPASLQADEGTRP